MERSLMKYDDNYTNVLKTCSGCGVKEGYFHKTGCSLQSSHILEKRVPYIEYPIICAKCGGLYPVLFMVSKEEWEFYIQENMRDKTLCFSCYDHIRSVIDGRKFASKCEQHAKFY